MTEPIVRELLQQADIVIGGPNPWDIQVHDRRFYRRVVRDRNLGLGESYMDGWWDCERIDEMICRLLKGRLEEKMRTSAGYLIRLLPALLFNLQSRSRARTIARHH